MHCVEITVFQRVQPVDDVPGDEAEERERQELAERQDSDRDR
jgi:hypothetical protein